MIVRWVIAVALFLSIAVSGVALYVQHLFFLPVLEQQSEGQFFIVRKGAGLAEISRDLGDISANLTGLNVKLIVSIMRASKELQAGEFFIEPGVSLSEVINTIRRGDVVQHSITFAEGLNTAQIIALLAADEKLKQDFQVVDISGLKGLLPETYAYTRGTKVSSILNRMEQAFLKIQETAWSRRQNGLALRSPQELIVLASIIEKETGVASERALVSAVFHNRLKQNMRLQSDPTVIYAVAGDSGLDRPLTRNDLRTDSPYNTYRVKGLPPTPIAHPGKASIIAAAFPAAVPYLYFVADGAGGHRFATRLEEHNANVAAYRRLQNQ